ncbi:MULTISPECIES: hypothetical protein [Brevibacterium]|uniref:Uncharacterized protein n=1 Tax=Brevibacterium antiquum CNRZ 918 TaxID=1255637 RepID=A0A2H1KDM2_9MICO|nr:MULTISPECIES: hypothetical protein [Brevibacterium]SMX97739.1 hypothetical protein BANT918_02354 [Brevibacterium antiquum CNRZ 918]HCG55360.1 hypothetical protein [Brevibacterium sp.]
MKTLATIKAVGAGVTALYLATRTAELARSKENRTEVEKRTAQQYAYAVDEFMKAVEKATEPYPKPEAYLNNYMRNVRTVFHGSDNS